MTVAGLVEFLDGLQLLEEEDDGDGHSALADHPLPPSAPCSWYDLLVAADVCVYLGDLGPFLRATARVARAAAAAHASRLVAANAGEAGAGPPNGWAPPPTLAFSVEAADDETEAETETEDESKKRSDHDDDACGSPGFMLTATGRFVHSERHVRERAAAHGWAVTRLQRAVLRRNAGKDVHGLLVVCNLACVL